MKRLSERADAERQGLVPEKQAPEREPWEVALREWWRTDFPTPADASTPLGDRLFRGGFEAGQAHARAELKAAAREALPAEDPQGGEVFWRCTGCSQDFKSDPGDDHERETCDGSGEPYLIQCGPVVRVGKENS